MLRNSIVTAYRIACRQRLHSTINLIGLVIGITVSTVVYLWVLDELGYDRFHENVDTLFRLEQDQHNSGSVFHVNLTSEPLGGAVAEEIPEIANSTRYGRMGEVLLKKGGLSLYDNGLRVVDPSFLTMFTFPLLEGDPITALSDPYSAVVTRSTALRILGRDKNILGETINLNNEHELTVTGVAEVPANTMMDFSLLVPYEFSVATGTASDSWGSNRIRTFVQLTPGADPEVTAEKVSALNFSRNNPDKSVLELPADENGNPIWRAEFSLLKVSDVYLHGYFGYSKSSGRLQSLFILACIGLLVLMIACINFMNLATSQASKRAREVGLRKTIGAVRRQLAIQFYIEAFVITTVAAALALILIELTLPAFNSWSGKSLSLNLFGNPQLLVGTIGVVLFTTMFAGSYPALLLSSFRPRVFLGGHLASGSWGRLLRRVSVGLQFVIAAAFIVGTLVAHQQSELLHSKDLGYETENLLTLRMRGNMAASYETFRQRLMNDEHIENVTGSWQHPTFNSANSAQIQWAGKDPELSLLVGVNYVDYDFVPTMGIEILEGRAFDRYRGGDAIDAFLINEELAKQMNISPIVGAKLSFQGTDGTVIGVTKDYHRTSLRRGIEPTILQATTESMNWVMVKLSGNSIQQSIASVQRIFNEVYSGFPFEYTVLEDDLGRMYNAEEKVFSLLRMASMIAVFLACLGMFGLASYSADLRTKEMAVHKVLGATKSRIFYMLSKEYLIVVGLANLATVPIAYYVCQKWLENFAYKAPVSVWLFVIAGFVTIAVALLSVSTHSIRTVNVSPALVLKRD